MSNKIIEDSLAALVNQVSLQARCLVASRGSNSVITFFQGSVEVNTTTYRSLIICQYQHGLG